MDPAVLRMILMSDTAKEIWENLLAVFERKSEQRLKSLYAYLQFLEYTKDLIGSLATYIIYISKLKTLCLELNEESFIIAKCKLPDMLLIMSFLKALYLQNNIK